MTTDSDPCNSAELKAQQKAILSQLLMAAGALAVCSLIALGFVGAFRLLVWGIRSEYGPYVFLATLTACIILILAATFHPSIKLGYCLLQERLKSSRPK